MLRCCTYDLRTNRHWELATKSPARPLYMMTKALGEGGILEIRAVKVVAVAALLTLAERR